MLDSLEGICPGQVGSNIQLLSFPLVTGQPPGDGGDAGAAGVGAGGTDVWRGMYGPLGLAWPQRQAELAEQLVQAHGQTSPAPSTALRLPPRQ